MILDNIDNLIIETDERLVALGKLGKGVWNMVRGSAVSTTRSLRRAGHEAWHTGLKNVSPHLQEIPPKLSRLYSGVMSRQIEPNWKALKEDPTVRKYAKYGLAGAGVAGAGIVGTKMALAHPIAATAGFSSGKAVNKLTGSE